MSSHPSQASFSASPATQTTLRGEGAPDSAFKRTRVAPVPGKRPGKTQLFEMLARERANACRLEQEIAAGGSEFRFDKADWISLWYDPGNQHVSRDGSQVAFRAITRAGELLWYVFTNGKTRGYHAEADCPLVAMQMARDSIAKRRFVKSQWREVEAFARQLRRLQTRETVLIEDAEASPLCAMGIRHFLRSIGVPNAKRLPGSVLAWLMFVEPQLGYVLYETAQRTRALEIEGAAQELGGPGQ